MARSASSPNPDVNGDPDHEIDEEGPEWDCDLAFPFEDEGDDDEPTFEG